MDKGSTNRPMVRSVRARLAIKNVNGLRRFLLGSTNTARMTIRFPGTVAIMNIMANTIVVNDTSGGAQTPTQWLAPSPIVVLRMCWLPVMKNRRVTTV